MDMRMVRRDLAFTAAVNLTVLVMGFATGVLTARGLDTHDRGLLIALVTWSGVVGSISMLGLDEALVYGARGEVRRGNALRIALRPIAREQAAIGSIALAIVAIHLLWPLRGTSAILAILVVAIVPLNVINVLGLAPLQIKQSMNTWNLIRIVPNIVYAGGLLILVSTGTLSLTSGLVSLVAGVALTSLVLAIRSARDRDLDQVVAAEPAPGDLAEIRRYGRRVVMASIPQQVGPRTDQLLLGIAAAPATLGIYAVSSALAGVLQTLGTSLEQVLFPKMVASRSSFRTTMMLAAAGCGACLAVSALLYIFAHPLVQNVYGNSYTGTIPALAPLLAAASVRVGAGVLAADLKARGALGGLTLANSLGVAVVAAGFPFVLHHGIASLGTLSLIAALASTAAQIAARVSSRDKSADA